MKKPFLPSLATVLSLVVWGVCLGIGTGWAAKLNGCKTVFDFQIIMGGAFSKKLWSGLN